MKKCVACKTNEVTVPDRNDVPRYRIRVCSKCHAERLAADLRYVSVVTRRTP